MTNLHYPAIDSPKYRTVDVCCLVGITYRQADYWARSGFIPQMPAAPGSGMHRQWTPRQVVQAFVVAKLMRRRFAGEVAAQVAELVTLDAEFVVVGADAARAYVATDLLDVLDGLNDSETLVIRLPDVLRAMIATGRRVPVATEASSYPAG